MSSSSSALQMRAAPGRAAAARDGGRLPWLGGAAVRGRPPTLRSAGWWLQDGDVAAVVGGVEVDQVGGGVGSGAGLGKVVAEGGDGQHAAAGCSDHAGGVVG